MVVNSIKFDRVTIKPMGGNTHILYGCFVTLGKYNSVTIQYTDDVSSERITNNIVMGSYEVVELTPWTLVFNTNIAENNKLLKASVVCEFNIFKVRYGI